MTNFDKWKEKLTPEDFVRVSEQWCGNLPVCNGCGNSDEIVARRFSTGQTLKQRGMRNEDELREMERRAETRRCM